MRCSDCCEVNCEFDTGDTGSVCPIGQYLRSLALQKKVQDIEQAQAHAIAVNVLAKEQAKLREQQQNRFDEFRAKEEHEQAALTLVNMYGSNGVV